MNKELEALENIRIVLEDEFDYHNDIETVKSALERKEKLETENLQLKERNKKLEKVWKIIKRNEYIDLEEVKKYSNYNDYNEQFREEYRLSKTEFNLLKELLEE